MHIKTQFEVRAFKVGPVTKHPNADSLSITEAFGNPVVFKTGSFNTGDWAVYIPVDSMVPTSRPEFAFLAKENKTEHRVRALKLRGIFSMGMLVPVPAGLTFSEDTDFESVLGVTKYQSPEELKEMDGVARREYQKKNVVGGLKNPEISVYGVDTYRKYSNVLCKEERVYVSEKIHGSSARFMHDGTRLWVGSHKVMRGASRTRFQELFSGAWLALKSFFKVGNRAPLTKAGDMWWQVAEDYSLKTKLSKKPGYVLYGEVYGEKVQDLTYDSPKGRKFVAFDVQNFKTGKFLDYKEFTEFCSELDLPTPPMLYVGPWTAEKETELKSWADTGTSKLNPKQMCEGFVLKPVVERSSPYIGRIILKYVGQNYLLKKE